MDLAYGNVASYTTRERRLLAWPAGPYKLRNATLAAGPLACIVRTYACRIWAASDQAAAALQHMSLNIDWFHGGTV